MPNKGQIFTGPREPVIPRERKYHLRNSREHDEYRPTIVYVDHQSGRLDEYEAIYTEDPWTQVVNDINDIAQDHAGATGGTFYVNEYKQVIKPVGTGPIVDIFVGEYPGLHFQFDIPGTRKIDNADVSGLQAGDDWPHHKVGIRYHYSAGRRQVFYRSEEGNVIRRVAISVPASLEKGLYMVKDGSGGQFYVNEHGHAFAPRVNDPIGPDVYVGSIDLQAKDWFDKIV